VTQKGKKRTENQTTTSQGIPSAASNPTWSAAKKQNQTTVTRDRIRLNTLPRDLIGSSSLNTINSTEITHA